MDFSVLNKYGQQVFARFVLLACLTACSFPFWFATGCANSQAPLGGAKDSIPPVLVESSPANNQINFTADEIRLEFNEYVMLNNLNEHLIINPLAERFPIITSKLRRVTIKIKDTLQPNTTYSFNFGQAIADVNESNPIKNFTYTFSTGKFIDSLELTGSVINAQTGLPDSTLTVILHTRGGDSVVVKEKPRYATRPNGQGVFRFQHLPNESFYIYAVKDEGLKRYTSNQILFAFNDTSVVAGSTDSIRLRAFVGEPETAKKPAISTPGLRGQQEKKDDKKLRYSTSVSNSAQDLLDSLRISFQEPMEAIDTTKIRLTDTLFNPLAISRFFIDSTATNISLAVPWKDDAHYVLLLDKGFATDSAGITITKADTINFKTKAESEYGALTLTVNGIDLSRNPVLQFVENDVVKLSTPLNGKVYKSNLFKPGQYKLRILYDANKNGIWDTGNYWERIQPEIVIPVMETISIRENWDNEVEINL